LRRMIGRLVVRGYKVFWSCWKGKVRSRRLKRATSEVNGVFYLVQLLLAPESAFA